MFSTRLKLASLAAVLGLAAGGYYMHPVDAVQGQGELAQAPLDAAGDNVPPAFIMAVDDSGSMSFQMMFPGDNGGACWDRRSDSFFSGPDGVMVSEKPPRGTCQYRYVMDRASYWPRKNYELSLPPVDKFGFARSSDFNSAYFNPAMQYSPWLRADGSSYPGALIDGVNTRYDPRQPGEAGKNVGTVDLGATSLVQERESDTFFVAEGMTLPEGTRYKRLIGGGNAWVEGPLVAESKAGSYWASNGDGRIGALNNPGGAGPEIPGEYVYIKYHPATFYLRGTGSTGTGVPVLPAEYAGVDRVWVDGADCGQGCPGLWRYTIRAQDVEALRNFANWFTYYRTRNLAMIAGMSHALADVSNMRVGFMALGSADGTFKSDQLTMRDMGSATEKARLYTEIMRLGTTNTTPNLWAVNRIGQHFQRKDAGAPIQYMCQKNAGMLFTDGYSNQGAPRVTAPDAAVVNGVPFGTTADNSMAAIASSYYTMNLREDLQSGQVPVPSECGTLDMNSLEWKRLDCQKNLHMNFYGITLGARGALFDPDRPDRDPYTDAGINTHWTGHTDNQPSTIDDIWHATVNTRGRFINARSPTDITAAMRTVLESVGDGNMPSGSIGVSGARVGADSLMVMPSYSVLNKGTDWYGELSAQKLSAGSGVSAGQVNYSPAWNASRQLPAASARNIRYGTGTGSQAFTAANVALDNLCDNPRPGMSRCTAAEIAALGIDVNQAVAYLRGDQSLEGTRLRQRTTRLGDIVNSTAVVSNPKNDDYGYASMRTGTSYDQYDYAGYRARKAARASTVYVGANDGMLHAFDGTTGVEKFAYIPRAVLGHMGNLLFPYNAADGGNQKFQHRYYVDGPVAVADAAFGAPASPDWRTVLVGSTGAGGRSVFGLDVSDQNLAASDVLWELDDQHANADVAGNIGHVLGKPVIAPVKDASGTARWKAIFGNGYGSDNGKAVLFVVDIASGKAAMIPAAEPGAPAGANGLGNIIVLDRKSGASAGRDGSADLVYATDQKGAVWRFDLSTMKLGTANMVLAPVIAPLFVATDSVGTRQPITGGLEASGTVGGVMLYFGTGSYSFIGDKSDRNQQTLYGVMDNGSATALGRENLLAQMVTPTAGDARMVSSLAMPMGKSGWFLDLVKATGERFVGYPRIENGIVFFATYEPGTDNVCGGNSGTNRLYGLNATSGGGALSQVQIGVPGGAGYADGTGAVDLHAGGVSKDLAILVQQRQNMLPPGASEAELDAALSRQCMMVVQVAGAPSLYLPRPCGRQSWRQLQ